MKNRLKELLGAGQPAIGTILQIPSAPLAEIVAQAGFDWLLVDAEHGPIGLETIHAMVRATSGTQTTPAVRIASNLDWLAKRVLDVGALAVMMPSVNSGAEALAAVRAVRYPPEGTRGVGPTFAALRWGLAGEEYIRNANREVMAIVQIETIEAVERIDEILAVPGIDLPLIGPYDLSASMGCSGRSTIPGSRRRSGGCSPQPGRWTCQPGSSECPPTKSTATSSRASGRSWSASMRLFSRPG